MHLRAPCCYALLLGLSASLSAVVACHAQPGNTSPSSARVAASSIPRVPPAETPRATWDSLMRDDNVLINPPSYTGRLVRNALWVRFHPAATSPDRASAIALIEGEVVGGTRLNSNDGYFLIRIPARAAIGDSSSGPVLRAQRTLKTHPSVASALLVTPERSP
jgi:hypothetical protein